MDHHEKLVNLGVCHVLQRQAADVVTLVAEAGSQIPTTHARKESDGQSWRDAQRF
jgi:hypothetical protein